MNNWSIDFAPLLPVPFFVAAAIVGLLLVGLLLWRRARGAMLRALAIVAMLAALANPTLRQEERDSLANIALVVIDESTSQTLANRPEQAQAIRTELDKKLGAIKNLEVKWVSAARPVDGVASGTQLFAELNRALANTPPDRLAGVVMVTDGQVHDVPANISALGFNAPVHALLTGEPDEFDRRIELVQAPRYGIVGQSRDITFIVRETGKTGQAGTEVSLTIRREGQPDEKIRTTIGRKTSIDMPFPHAGQNILEMELETADGELTPANNRVVVAAEGVRENLRVLLVSGEPHAGERTWRNLLKSDAAVDLVHFTILRPPEKQDGTPINQLSLIAFPTRELFSEKIKDFDLIIFDRYQHRGILQMMYYDNIARYVEDHGGALLIAAGDDYAGRYSVHRTPLAAVLPATPTGRVIEQPFKADTTADGEKHPVTRGLPGAANRVAAASTGTTNDGISSSADKGPSWGRWFRQVEVTPERGTIVMKGAEDAPLLILDRKGKGRVALLTSDQAWLWARGYDGGGPHTDLLRRLSHWLMKEPDLEEERLFASARGLKLTVERRTMDDSVPPVTVRNPHGKTHEITLEKVAPGLFRSTEEVERPGLYKVTQGELSAIAHAGVEDVREMSEVTATEKKLEPLLEESGGGVFWTRSNSLFGSGAPTDVTVPRIAMMPAARVMAGNGWLGLKDRAAYVTRGVKLTPMFTGFAALAALLAFMALAWWREGR
ncbi:MAG: hypothetical protein KDJ45_02980 [Hyphomicrobiaceae bacterium]|nr:hypothetical protein [Hyphomicrobiaceae bacterium]MCC0011438.1 hypothetical protein [Hyphomicrobiaceae bacterium]